MSLEVKSTLTVLSESNHRLSHVAETGHLIPRTRQIKHNDPWSPSFDPQMHHQTYNFSLPRSRPASPMDSFVSKRPRSYNGFSDRIETLHAPRPLLTVDFAKMARRSFSDPRTALPNAKSPINNLLYPGQQVSPILAEYLSDSFNGTPYTVSTHSMRSSRVSSVISTPEPIAYSASTEYRKANPNFEVRRGTMGSLAIPLELPPLELPSLTVKERRKSKRLQKKRQTPKTRSKSVGATPSRIPA
jgi:hypothetical protein